MPLPKTSCNTPAADGPAPGTEINRASSAMISNARPHTLTGIIDIGDLQRLQDSFAQANRVASTIIDLDGRRITRFSNYSRVCQLLRRTENGPANCTRSGKILGRMSLQSRQPACHFCLSVGFIDAAAPIVIDGCRYRQPADQSQAWRAQYGRRRPASIIN